MFSYHSQIGIILLGIHAQFLPNLFCQWMKEDTIAYGDDLSVFCRVYFEYHQSLVKHLNQMILA